MAHTEWIKVVRTGLSSRQKRQSSYEGSRRPMKPRSPPPARQGQNKFSALAVNASSSDVKTRFSSSAGRRITGAGFTSVMPKDKFQPAFSRALKARVAFLKRRLSSAEMKNLARSVRRGWTPAKKSLLSKGRKPGLGYIPNQKPKYSDVLKSAKVPAPPAAFKGIEFKKGKTLFGSLPQRVAKSVPTDKSLPSLEEAKAKIEASVSIGQRYLASVQERSVAAALLGARIQLYNALRKSETSSEKSVLISKFRASYPDVIKQFIHCSSYSDGTKFGKLHTRVRVFIDMDAIIPSAEVDYVSSRGDLPSTPFGFVVEDGRSTLFGSIGDPLASVVVPGIRRKPVDCFTSDEFNDLVEGEFVSKRVRYVPGFLGPVDPEELFKSCV